jgi:hypothetical protein
VHVFLRIISGWPASPFDWDILFLCRCRGGGRCSRRLYRVTDDRVGTLVTQWHDRNTGDSFTRASWGVSWAGILLALGVFMADSIRALPGGLDTVRQVLPTAFNWPVFGAALLLMATPLAYTGWRSLSSRREVSGSRRFDPALPRYQ